jgi:hypothetical protein
LSEINPPVTPAPTFKKGWRFYLGIGLFILCLIGPLLALVVAFLPISDRLKAVLSAGLVFGLPEVFGVLAIAVLGRQTFDYLMAPIWRWFRGFGPPRTVSRIRYTVGLIMFGAPLVEGAIFLHSRDWQQLYEGWYVAAAIIWDGIFLGSFFVLGGDFWDKVRALFVYDAKAVFKTNEPFSVRNEESQ